MRFYILLSVTKKSEGHAAVPQSEADGHGSRLSMVMIRGMVPRHDEPAAWSQSST
jgi:hypothetical protein